MNTSQAKTTAFLLIAEVLLFIIMEVVGTMTGFAPGVDRSLDQFLPAVAQNHSGLIIVYLAYVFSGVVLIPIALLLPRLFSEQDSLLQRVGVAFGITSAILRIISVSRYLFFVPFLADTYVSNPSSRSTVIFAYQANDAFAGAGLGEYLGDGLFLCLWLSIIVFSILRTRRLPAWTGWTGAFVAFLLACVVIFSFFPPAALLTPLSLAALVLWFIALFIVLLRLPDQRRFQNLGGKRVQSGSVI
jgi:hypothetical protein